MKYTPRTCPGPGDLWQLSPEEEEREDEYERLCEEFWEEFIPSTGNELLIELGELGIDDDPEIEMLFDYFLEKNGWR